MKFIKIMLLSSILFVISCNSDKGNFRDHPLSSYDGNENSDETSASPDYKNDYALEVELEKPKVLLPKITSKKEIWVQKSLLINGYNIKWNSDRTRVMVQGQATWNQPLYDSIGEISFSLVGEWNPDIGISDLVLINSDSKKQNTSDEVKGRVYCVGVNEDGICKSTVIEIFVRIKGLIIFSGQSEKWVSNIKKNDEDSHPHKKKIKKFKKKAKNQDTGNTDLTEDNDIVEPLRDEIKGNNDDLEIVGGTDEESITDLFEKEDVQHPDDEIKEKKTILPNPNNSLSPNSQLPQTPNQDEELEKLFNNGSQQKDSTLKGEIVNDAKDNDTNLNNDNDIEEENNKNRNNQSQIPLPRRKPLRSNFSSEKDFSNDFHSPIPRHKPPISKSSDQLPENKERNSNEQTNPPSSSDPLSNNQSNQENGESIRENEGFLKEKLLGNYVPFQSIGLTNNGHLQNSTNLLEVIRNIESNGVMSKFPLRSVKNKDGIHFGNYAAMEFLIKSSFWLNRIKPGLNLEVNDISAKNGGSLREEHASHQNGLDMDIGFFFKNMNINYYGKSTINKNTLASNFDPSLQWKFFKTIMNYYHDKIFIIFVHPMIKKAMCEQASKEMEINKQILTPQEKALTKETLRRLVPESGHHNHFHVRIRCPIESPIKDKNGNIKKSRCVQTRGDLAAVTGCNRF